MNPNRFQEKSFSYAAIMGIFCCFVAAIFLEDIIFSLGIGLACFALVFLIQLLTPVLRERKRVALIEAELPFALMSISVDLGLNIAFEKCILNASKSSSAVSKEFKRIFFDIKEKGLSVQQALLAFSQRTKSVVVKRAVLQLGSVYEQGSNRNSPLNNSEGVRRIAIELLAKQRAETKEFSGKLVVFSLMFIAVSAIVPALFQSFAVVGSMILKMGLTAMQIFLIIVLGFPLLDLLVLLYIQTKTPVFLREG